MTLLPDRRHALDLALAQLQGSLPVDAPAWMQLDYFLERVDPPPALREWCLWLWVMPDEPFHLFHLMSLDTENLVLDPGQRLSRLRLLWAAYLEQTEPEKCVEAKWVRGFRCLRFRLVENTMPIWRTYRNGVVSEPARRPSDFEQRPVMLQEWKLRLLSLFPEVEGLPGECDREPENAP